MKLAATMSELPAAPAIYALLGGNGNTRTVAYVGSAERLRQRIRQHLITRDSSVTTGAAIVSLNPDLVTEVLWWEHPLFAERARLEAAELVAFDILEPTLRSRGAVPTEARKWYEDPAYSSGMRALIAGEPSGRLTLPSLQDALRRIAELERRLALLEARLAAQ